jgi:hypothetical protein
MRPKASLYQILLQSLITLTGGSINIPDAPSIGLLRAYNLSRRRHDDSARYAIFEHRKILVLNA